MILSGDNALFLEELYQTFRKDARLVPPEWSHYFQQLEASNGSQDALDPSTPSTSNGRKSKLGTSYLSNGKPAASLSSNYNLDYKEVGVQSLTESYRRFGNLAANLDPLDLQQKNRKLLELEHYGLSTSDLEREFSQSSAGPKKGASQRYCPKTRGLLLQFHRDRIRLHSQHRRARLVRKPYGSPRKLTYS